MKKNKTMRLAVLLLVLTLVTSCFVGGTFARYITTSSATASARVAYWGFNSTETAEFDLFDFTDNGILDGDENLIAPGSSNSVKFTFATPQIMDTNKAPEVDYRVVISASGSGPSYAFLGGSEPNEWPMGGIDGLIIWTIKVGDGEVQEYTTWKSFVKGIGALDGSADGGKVYEAGEKANILYGEETIEIGWRWPYENVGETGMQYNLYNAADTKAGNNALNSNGKVTLKIDVTVEQVS